METSTAVTLILVYLACLGTLWGDIVTDHENDMLIAEKVFWSVLAPIAVLLMIYHEIQEFERQILIKI